MTEITNLLARNLTDISNERNHLERLAAVQELWAQHGVMMVDDGTYVGHSAIEIAAGALLSCYPECDFTPLGITDEVAAAGRQRWVFGAAGESPAITGEDVVLVSEGRIVALYRFLDGPAM